MAASRYLHSQGWDFMLNSSFQAGLWSCLGLHKTWVCCGLHYELPCAAVLYSGDTVFLSLTTPVSYTFFASSPTEPCKGELYYIFSVKDRVFCTLWFSALWSVVSLCDNRCQLQTEILWWWGLREKQSKWFRRTAEFGNHNRCWFLQWSVQNEEGCFGSCRLWQIGLPLWGL